MMPVLLLQLRQVPQESQDASSGDFGGQKVAAQDGHQASGDPQQVAKSNEASEARGRGRAKADPGSRGLELHCRVLLRLVRRCQSGEQEKGDRQNRIEHQDRIEA